MRKPSITELFTALRDAVPIMVSVASYGVVFGFLARSSGLGAWQTQAMSVFVFAGSSQLAALPLLDAGASPMVIIGTTLIINGRHLLMSSSLVASLGSLSRRWLAFASWWITDESFALSSSRYETHPPDPWYLVGAGLAVFLSWNLSTLLGYRFATVITDPGEWHLGFIAYAAFIGLLVPMIHSARDLLVTGGAALISVAAALLLPGYWYILAAGLAAPLLALGEGDR